MLTAIVNALVSAVGEDSVFKEVQDDPLYKGAMDAIGVFLPSSPLLMAFGFVKATDPWGGVLKDVMAAIVEIFQRISGTFLYGCDVFADPACGDLPSLWNQVLSNSLK